NPLRMSSSGHRFEAGPMSAPSTANHFGFNQGFLEQAVDMRSGRGDSWGPGGHTSPSECDAGPESTPHPVAAYETESSGLLSDRTISRPAGLSGRGPQQSLQVRQGRPGGGQACALDAAVELEDPGAVARETGAPAAPAGGGDERAREGS